jgi:hypothetical protein
MMELSGFEPLTLSMPLRCATNCAIAPYAFLIMTRDRGFVKYVETLQVTVLTLLGGMNWEESRYSF